MSDSNIQPSKSGRLVSGGLIGCVSILVLAGVLWPLLHVLGGTLDENVMISFPVLIGLPCFITGHVLAVISVCSKTRIGRQRGKRALLVMWGSIVASIVILLVVPEPSSKSILGDYFGSYGGVSEVLKLEEGGIFAQELTLPSGEKLTTRGSWELNHRAVTLYKYLEFIDVEKGSPALPPRLSNGLTYTYRSGVLLYDLGSGYYAPKRR